jgi:SAM-dependent methyltransferase
VPEATSQPLLTWEKAEIQRSSVEAVRTAALVRATSADVFARYRAPVADTAYPLEYAFFLVGDVAGARVLDIGCGSGANATLLAARGARVVGVDISPDLLALARRRAAMDRLETSVRVLCGSTHAIPLPDASVDLVFGNAILHHVDLPRTAAEIRRVLVPGGRGVFKEPVRTSRAVGWLRSLIPLRPDIVSPHERPLRPDQLDAFAAQFSGFRSREFWLPFISAIRMTSLRRRPHLAPYGWDRALLQRYPRLRRFASVTVFEVTR